jgi:hypothetical protein
MRNDAPTPRGGVTEPNELDIFRRREREKERRKRALAQAHRPTTASMRLASATSPSRESKSTELISRK